VHLQAEISHTSIAIMNIWCQSACNCDLFGIPCYAFGGKTKKKHDLPQKHFCKNIEITNDSA
jgi:hypothetical protein